MDTQGVDARPFTAFGCLRQPEVTRKEKLTWSGLYEEILNQPEPRETPKDDLSMWAPADMDRAEDEKVRSVSCLVYDDDVAYISDEEAAGKIPFLAYLFPSSSYTQAKPARRIVIATSRAHTADEHERLWPAVAARLGFEVASNSRNPSRRWYWPRVPEEGSYFVRRVEGPIVDVDAVLADTVPARVVANPPTVAPKADAETPARRALAAKLLGAAWPARGRHDTQNAVGGALVREGWSEQEATDFLCEVCRVAGDEDRPKRESTIRDAIDKRDSGSKFTGWPELEKHVDSVVVSTVRRLLTFNGADVALERWVEKHEKTSWSAPEVPLALKRLDLLTPPEPIEHLVSGVFELGTVSMLVAAPGSMKSWTLYSIGLAVAAGTPWLGKYETRKAKVLLLDWEMGEARARRRMRMLAKGQDPGIFYARNLGNPHHQEFWETVERLTREADIGVVLYDSLGGASGGEDENYTAFALPLKFAARLDRLTHIWIHHAKKGATDADNNAQVMSFDRPAQLPVYLTITVSLLPGAVIGTVAPAVKAALEFLNATASDENSGYQLLPGVRVKALRRVFVLPLA